MTYQPKSDTTSLTQEAPRRNEVATVPFGEYPLYLKPTDIQDATQYSKPVVYQMIREMEKIPGIVYRQKSGRGVRVDRDKFFNWFAEHYGMR